MRLPPNYGSVSKLSGKRRNPYVVRITTGYNDKGRQQYKVIGYAKTRKEGLELLAGYHANPHEMAQGMTFEELYDKYLETKEGKVSKASMDAYRIVFKASPSLHKMQMKDIKTHHMQVILDEGDRSKSFKTKLKGMYSQMFELAIQNDLIEKNYAQFLDTGKAVVKQKKEVFSPEEIKLLWEHEGEIDVDLTLILLYTGMRVGELMELKMENIHPDERHMIGGLKTDAGRDRIIPIHHKILPIVKRLYGDGSQPSMVLNKKGKPHSYRTFLYAWEKKMVELGIEHTFHETRHTFISGMYKTDVKPEIIKKIVGHAGGNVTESVYLHVDVNQLVEAVDKLKL